MPQLILQLLLLLEKMVETSVKYFTGDKYDADNKFEKYMTKHGLSETQVMEFVKYHARPDIPGRTAEML